MNSLEAVISSEIKRELEAARNEYIRRVNESLSADKLPMEEDNLRLVHKTIADEVLAKLQVRSKNFVDTDQLSVLRSNLTEIMESELKIKLALNISLSENQSLKLFLSTI